MEATEEVLQEKRKPKKVSNNVEGKGKEKRKSKRDEAHTTTLLTSFPFFLADLRTPTVPWTAGPTSSDTEPAVM